MSFTRRSFLLNGIKTIVAIGAANTIQSFRAGAFALPPANKIQMRFAIASDGHYGQPNTPFEAQHLEMVNWLNAEKQHRGLDFTMINGDIFHNETANLPLVKANWDKLTMPYHVSHGNHDMIDEAAWLATWQTPWHYTFEHKDNAFLVLNTADDKGNYISPDAAYTREQLTQLAGKKKLFVFMHITPFNWTKGGLPCPDIVALFNKQENLKAVFHGHDHNMDDVKENEGKFYFFDAHIGGSWGTDYRGYRIVEILKNGTILTYQTNPANASMVNSKTL
ncbi:metallophosphoesterase family protein [Limnovirga soli]|jgi:hypothetical protein|uniref:Transcriptional regulator n=1 Tax=Limnovirga soli TaxID=2656915 RepID=A0A8J8FDR0_9BACT|nr:metallophosphoesterase [Limnovirga soli]NNV55810.1 transcriptional regulator [Limnovirga soli]